VLAVRPGDRAQGIGRIRVGLLRHVGACARCPLVVALTPRGRAARRVVLRVVRHVVVVERVVKLGGL